MDVLHRQHSTPFPTRQFILGSPGDLPGSISATGLELSAAGQMTIDWLTELPNKFRQVALDTFVIMPDHIHTIIVLHEIHQQEAEQSPLPTLGDIVGWYKTMTTNTYIQGVRQEQWPPLASQLL